MQLNIEYGYIPDQFMPTIIIEYREITLDQVHDIVQLGCSNIVDVIKNTSRTRDIKNIQIPLTTWREINEELKKLDNHLKSVGRPLPKFVKPLSSR